MGNRLQKNAVRGTSRWHREGQLVFVKWKDTKDVCVISTYHEATGSEMVKRRKKVDGQYKEMQVTIPPAIRNYNRYMGGVDLSDQIIQYNGVLRKTKKWWKTLFFHFIDVCVVNAYIIYRALPGKENTSQKDFRKQLLLEMVQRLDLAPPKKRTLADHHAAL